MNWLAHLTLSQPDAPSRLGQLLADLLTLPEQALAPPECQDGMRHHRAIDAYTDQHPVVVRAMGRFPAPWRRYAGVLVDLHFDHSLARRFERHAGRPLSDFTAEVYDGMTALLQQPPVSSALPGRSGAILQAMVQHDLLGSYQHPAGIEAALARMAGRLRRPVPLQEAAPVLAGLDDALSEDFEAFFPDLMRQLDAPAWRRFKG